MSEVHERITEVCDGVDDCPVCGSPDREVIGYQNPNRYSEEIATLLGVDEEALLEAIRDMRCQDCGLGYKDWWFKPDFYYKVFVEAAPVHPRGWDAALVKYTPARFLDEVDRLERAVAEGDRAMINRQRRTVQSYVDNVPRSQQEDPRVADVIARFRDLDLDHAGPADLELLRREVAPLIDRPKPFGRFQGFNDDSLEALIRRHVPELRDYGEVACPLWGLLPRFAGAGIETWFLKDENRAFWGPGCCNEDGQSCFDYAREVLGVDHVTTLSAMIERSERLDLLGIVNFLDHLASPLEFLRGARSVADTLLVVLVPDFPGGPGVIQHHTSFDRSVVTRLASEIGLRLTETVPCGDSPEPEFFAYLLA